ILQAARMGSQMDDRPVTTGAEGSFTFTALPAGQQYTVIATLNGYGQKSYRVQLDETNLVEVPPLMLRPANQTIAGKVVDDKDKPVWGADAKVAGEDQPQANAQTDSKGRFKFKVCEGDVRLFANTQRGFAQANGRAGDTNLVIVVAEQVMRMAPRARRAPA